MWFEQIISSCQLKYLQQTFHCNSNWNSQPITFAHWITRSKVNNKQQRRSVTIELPIVRQNNQRQQRNTSNDILRCWRTSIHVEVKGQQQCRTHEHEQTKRAAHHACGAPYISRCSVSATEKNFYAAILSCLNIFREMLVLHEQARL